MRRKDLLFGFIPPLRWILASVFLILVAAIPVTSWAEGAISQAFTTTESTLKTGSVVSLKSNSKGVVESATSTSRDRLLGVVGNKTLLELNTGNQAIQVVVTGKAPVLVSDINGAVKTGDLLTASPIVGVTMKATTTGLVVGTAQEDLSRVTTSTHTVKDQVGKSQTVKIGLLPTQVGVSYYAPEQDKIKPLLPAFLLTVGKAVAGKDISGLRVVIGIFVLILGFLTVAVMLQAGIRSGISAIGRNPLAHSDIQRGLVDVTVTALAVLGLTLMAIYIILTA